MQNLNFRQASNLNAALNYSEIIEVNGQPQNKIILKSGKHLSSNNFLKLSSVQKKLRDFFADMADKEKKIFEDYDYVLSGTQWTSPPIDEKDQDQVKKRRDTGKEIAKKLEAVHKGDGYEVRKESRGKDKSKAVVKKIPLEEGTAEDTVLQIPDPFIPKNEFLEWTKECSGESASILAEFLLVDFEK